jgi:drug/metabolite transporter (DMT)-like permease
VGYAEGGRVARTLGGWRTICWCLAASLPLTIPATLWLTFPMTEMPSSQSLMALLYLALFSSLLGFFPWYKAMALGGVARIGQVQLAQPFLTVLISAVWLSEQVDLLTWLSCIVIIAIIAASRRA